MDASLEQTGAAQGIVELVTVLVAVTDFKARVLTVDNGTMLPQGPLSPVHRSLQSGVRLWVAQQTAQPMGWSSSTPSWTPGARTTRGCQCCT